MKIIVTGGAGFIGSAVVRKLIRDTSHQIKVIDKLTYAGNLESIKTAFSNTDRFSFDKIDITSRESIRTVFNSFKPDIVMHLAAESHVDRSIEGPSEFINTNIVGTFTLLDEAMSYWKSLDQGHRETFRFHHISTDEVYGSLGDEGRFTETTPYAPTSPYSASKASSDHLVGAYFHTYKLPVLLTNCSNNYGPFHFPEKLIPLIIINALQGKKLPVYGRGLNVRDWLYVEDHADALWTVVTKGQIGETYNIGGDCERANLHVVQSICRVLDETLPSAANRPHESLITYVTDRPGHDLRYAIDASKIRTNLGWRPKETFESGIKKTVNWYLENRWWWEPILAKKYAGERIGLERKH